MSESTGNGPGSQNPSEGYLPGINRQDPDELYFKAHPTHRECNRPAIPGEWQEGNELHTSPPYTLAIQIKPGLLLKLGAWRSNADTHNTILQLNQGRLALASYLERLGVLSS